MLKHRSTLLGLMCLLALATAGAQADAYQVEPAPWSVLATKAERAVQGHVTARLTAWAPDGSGRVVTHYELLVWDERVATGPSDDAYAIVTLPGGRLGTRTTVIPGLRPFEIGDELLLLLTDTAWGWQPIGYELGVVRLHERGASYVPELRVFEDPRFGEARVKP